MTRAAWLVTGAGGQLGSVLLRRLVHDGEPALGLASPAGPAPELGPVERLELTDQAALTVLLEQRKPRVIVHCAAISTAAEVYRNPERAERVNVGVTAELAAWADREHARFIAISTDMLFDGEGAPYDETATPAPLSAYGRSKLAGEKAALQHSSSLVVRLPLLYGVPAVRRPTTFLTQMSALAERRPLDLFHDEFRTPLWLEDAAAALIAVAGTSLTGILHAAGPERLSRLEMGRRMADALGVKNPQIRALSRLDLPGSEPRARDLSLQSERYRAVMGAPPGRSMRDALAEIVVDPALRREPIG